MDGDTSAIRDSQEGHLFRTHSGWIGSASDFTDEVAETGQVVYLDRALNERQHGTESTPIREAPNDAEHSPTAVTNGSERSFVDRDQNEYQRLSERTPTMNITDESGENSIVSNSGSWWPSVRCSSLRWMKSHTVCSSPVS